MTNLTKEEYARLHLKAKHGLLTPEEQAVYFEYREEQAEAARAAAAPPPAPEPTPEVVRVEPVYEEPKERKARGFFAGFFSPSSDGYQLRCPRCGGTNVTVQTVSEMKKRGCLSILLMLLIACTIIGIPFLIIWVILRGRRTVTKKYAVCQTCGHSWTVH